MMENSNEKRKISVDKYRNHPPRKKHPQLIRMIIYLVMTILIGWYIYFYLPRLDIFNTIENENTEEFEVEVEI